MRLLIYIFFIGFITKSISTTLVDLNMDSVVIIPQRLQYEFYFFNQNYPYSKYSVIFKNDTIKSDSSIYKLVTKNSDFGIQILDSTNKLVKNIKIKTYQITPKMFFQNMKDSLNIRTKLVQLKIEKINYNLDIFTDTLQSFVIEIYNKKGIVYSAIKSEILLTEKESRLIIKNSKNGVILLRNLKINDRFGNIKHYWVNEVKF